MGILICPKHGQQGIVPFIEMEISQKITEGIPISKHDIVIVEAAFLDETGTLLATSCYMLSKRTFEQNNFKKKYSIQTEGEELDFLGPIQKLASGFVCSKCLEEYKTINAWDR